MTKTESRSGLVVLLLSLVIGLYHYRAQLPRIRPRHLGFAMLGLAIMIPLVTEVMPAGSVARIQSLSILNVGTPAHTDASLGRRDSCIVIGIKVLRQTTVLGIEPTTL